MSRGNIAIWFDPATQWYAPSKGKQGRNQTYSDAAIQCCLMIKSLFRLSLRMVTGFVQSLIKLCGLNWTAPDYSTLCRRQKHIDIVISYQKSSDGLHLLMDSTGMKFLGEGEWNRKKHGPEYRRQWRKLHIGIIEEIKYSLIAERLGYETAEIFLDWIQGKQEPTFTELTFLKKLESIKSGILYAISQKSPLNSFPIHSSLLFDNKKSSLELKPTNDTLKVIPSKFNQEL